MRVSIYKTGLSSKLSRAENIMSDCRPLIGQGVMSLDESRERLLHKNQTNTKSHRCRYTSRQCHPLLWCGGFNYRWHVTVRNSSKMEPEAWIPNSKREPPVDETDVYISSFFYWQDKLNPYFMLESTVIFEVPITLQLNSRKPRHGRRGRQFDQRARRSSHSTP